MGPLTAIKNWLHPKVPMDQLQLEAAQSRLLQRKKDLTHATDELTKMLDRMRKPRRGKSNGK